MFDSFFKLPLKLDSYYSYVFDSNNEMILESLFEYEDAEMRKLSDKVIDKLNGLNNEIFEASYNDEILTVNGNELFNIRGFGYLNGGLKIPPEEVCRIQDEICNEFIKILKHE